MTLAHAASFVNIQLCAGMRPQQSNEAGCWEVFHPVFCGHIVLELDSPIPICATAGTANEISATYKGTTEVEASVAVRYAYGNASTRSPLWYQRAADWAYSFRRLVIESEFRNAFIAAIKIRSKSVRLCFHSENTALRYSRPRLKYPELLWRFAMNHCSVSNEPELCSRYFQ
jgi:hypothetical protein